MIARCQELAELARQAGRGPIPITIAGMMRDPERIERFAQAGVAIYRLALRKTSPVT